MKKQTPAQQPSICFVAGCSGGHILPCLTLAHHEREKNPNLQVLFFTTNRALDKKIIASAAGIVTHHIALPLASASYGKFYKLPLLAWHLMRSFCTSITQLRKWHPEYVLTTGSHIAIPVCLAAWVLRIPVKLFEVNVLPGKTVKLLARFAQEIFVCYAQTKQYLPARKCILEPYPVKFTNSDKTLSQKEALTILTAHEKTAADVPALENNFNHAKKTILILGGSQGSLFLNQLIKKIVESDTPVLKSNAPTLECVPTTREESTPSRENDSPALTHAQTNAPTKTTQKPLRDGVQIIHQTGDLDQTDWKRFYAQREIPAIVFAYRDQMAPYYAAADIVICRAGAGTLAELIFFQKKSIVIPLETSATAHQLDNALAAAQKHPTLITVLRQSDLTGDAQKLTHALTNVLS